LKNYLIIFTFKVVTVSNNLKLTFHKSSTTLCVSTEWCDNPNQRVPGPKWSRSQRAPASAQERPWQPGRRPLPESAAHKGGLS
jgi:hypothetical protein